MPDWKADLETILRQIPGYNPWDQADDAWLDHAAAAHAINWFADHLRHVEGAARGEPFILRKWQAAIIGNLFGWKRKDEAGRIVRRYRRCFLLVARGNGKTPLSSGIVLYSLFNDDEPGAQDYLAAGQREQAGILFRNCAGMVDQDKELAGAVTIYRGDQHRSLVLKNDPLSFVRVIPADAAGQHGGIPHVTLIDELHVQESRDLLDVFETAMSKKVRRQPLLVMISTADYDRPSICNEVYADACRVRDNGGDKSKPGYDPSFLPVLYELKNEDDWTNEERWIDANPNLDVSVSRESLRKTVQKAQENPAKEAACKRLHFNLRTKAAVNLIHMNQWDACNKALDMEALQGRDCYAGLDLSSCEDIASMALIFPMGDEEWAVLSWNWCPAEKVKARAGQRIPYDVWAKDGFLTTTPGNQICYAAIEEEFHRQAKRFTIKEAGFDPWGATHLMQNIQAAYGDGFAWRIPQTHANLSVPTKEIIRRTKLGKIIHGGNPVLRWAVSNVAGYYKGKLADGQNLEDHLDRLPVIPSKQASADKIDPFAALVNAAARLMEHPDNAGQSVYETRGLMVL